ncbi:MAG TPA: hypothetical protein VH186_39145 [Chloroflexia bacterium]|nr:hypothetical protein [Chloroflexia bacterium]
MSSVLRSAKKTNNSRSISVFPLHLGGSNGSKVELDAIFTPPYNAAKYGITFTSSPRQADVILLLGAATPKALGPALDLLQSLPDSVKLVLLGSDATSGAPFAETYATLGPLIPAPEGVGEEDLPGNALPPGKYIASYVAGSPPDPQVIINAILAAANKE